MSEQRLRDEPSRAAVDDGARARALGASCGAALLRARAGRRAAPRLGAGAGRRRRACWRSSSSAVASRGPGDAVARWVTRPARLGREDARPALVRVPGGGRLLVTAEGGRGAWVVSADGSRRRLGDYAGASWSPHGRFVVAWRGGELLAVEPGGRVRWSLARHGRIAAARWAPVDGYRVAYLSGRSLRVVNGDGTGDRRYAAAAGVAPAWRPDGRHVLAYVDRRDHVRVAAVDSRRELWRSRAVGGAVELAWSPDGRRLLVATAGGWWVLGADGLVLARGAARPGFPARRRRLVPARQLDRRRAPRFPRQRRRAGGPGAPGPRARAVQRARSLRPGGVLARRPAAARAVAGRRPVAVPVGRARRPCRRGRQHRAPVRARSAERAVPGRGRVVLRRFVTFFFFFFFFLPR